MSTDNKENPFDFKQKKRYLRSYVIMIGSTTFSPQPLDPKHTGRERDREEGREGGKESARAYLTRC
jgi:hypothetical protein